MKKSNTTFLLIIATAFFFVSTLVLLYLNYFSPKVQPAIPSTIGILPTASLIPTAIPSASDWKTYSDDVLNVQFKYPSSFSKDIDNDGNYYGVNLRGPDYHTESNDMGILNLGTYFTFSNNKSCSITSMPELATLIDQNNNYKFYRVKGVEGPDYKVAIIKKTKGGCVDFYCSSTNLCEGSVLTDYNQILSTFKFTSSDSASNLTTYENKELGFSFQYDSSKHLLQTNKNSEEAINNSKKYYNFDLNPVVLTLWKGKTAVSLDGELTMHFNPNQIFNTRIIDNISISPQDYVAKLCEPEYGPGYLTSSGFKRVVLDNIVMYSFNSGGIGNGTYNYVFFNNDKIISFETSEPEITFETNPELNQILSTFKFL